MDVISLEDRRRKKGSCRSHYRTPGQVKKIFDQRERPRKFMEEDKVLLWDKRTETRGAHNKFEIMWKGPFVISQELGSNAFRLKYFNGDDLPLSYNGQNLKVF